MSRGIEPIPIALDRLTRNLFVSGDFYRGDLLGVVLRAERAFWLQSPSEPKRAQDLAAQALKRLPRLKTTDEIRASQFESAEDLLGFPPTVLRNPCNLQW